MHGPTPPAPDIAALRRSRVAVLTDLAEAAGRRIAEAWRGFETEAPGARSLAKAVLAIDRLSRWLRVAVFLAFRIGQGALDAPRPPRPLRRRTVLDEQAAEARAAEREARPEQERVERFEGERLERYLDRPFGETVARICRGLGLKPDWTAWAGEPWAREEIRAPAPTSPYLGWRPPRPDTPPPTHVPRHSGLKARLQATTARIDVLAQGALAVHRALWPPPAAPPASLGLATASSL